MRGRPSILRKIFEIKRERVEAEKRASDIALLAEQAELKASGAESFRLSDVIDRKDRVNIIAEIKRASPSKGVINDAFDPSEKALQYEQSGAAAISVLTEEDHFQGSIEDLVAARDAVSLPILRKDFIFDPFQIVQARLTGADAVLLIAAMLEDEQIGSLMEVSDSLNLDALVEVHDRDELARAESLGARLIGVNNRNLNSFDVSLDTSRELIRNRPSGALMISESGIDSLEQILELKGLGYDGFLIGEALMKRDSLHLSDIRDQLSII